MLKEVCIHPEPSKINDYSWDRLQSFNSNDYPMAEHAEKYWYINPGPSKKVIIAETCRDLPWLHTPWWSMMERAERYGHILKGPSKINDHSCGVLRNDYPTMEHATQIWYLLIQPYRTMWELLTIKGCARLCGSKSTENDNRLGPNQRLCMPLGIEINGKWRSSRP